jgi:hypothetical protein
MVNIVPWTLQCYEGCFTSKVPVNTVALHECCELLIITICTEAHVQVGKWWIKSLNEETRITCVDAVGSAHINILVCLELPFGGRPFRMSKKLEIWRCWVWTVWWMLQHFPSLLFEPLCGHPDCVECHIVMEDDNTAAEQHLSVCPACCSIERHWALIVSSLGRKSTNNRPLAFQKTMAIILHQRWLLWTCRMGGIREFPCHGLHLGLNLATMLPHFLAVSDYSVQ